MSSRAADVVVVGAGLLGLASARALARRGHDVLVLEAEQVGNERAGSKGSARIFRYGYDDPMYVRMAVRSRALWHELEDEAGSTLLEQTGQLTFGDGLGMLAGALSDCSAPCRLLEAGEVRERWPLLRAAEAVLEPESGVLLADRCLDALRRQPGVEVRERCEVVRVEDGEDGVTVRLREGALRARAAIVCAGGRSGALLDEPDGAVRRITTLEQVAYLGDRSGGAGPLSDLPILISRSDPLFYSLPLPGSPLVKAGLHGAGPVTNPAAAELDEDPQLLAGVVARAADLVPDAAIEVGSSERCLYDTTADEDFVLDRLGNVVIGCGTSGHGFKFGPYLGERLAELALGTLPGDDLARFRLVRVR